ncbi:MAG: hypothetical protein GY953_20915, partial [bacterium]|nr:hypothetical protein [bacterium]
MKRLFPSAPRPLLASLLVAASIGSVPANTITVNTFLDQLDDPSGPEISLREAVRDAGDGTSTICFDPALAGATFRLNGSSLVIRPSAPMTPAGEITIDASTLSEPIIIAPGTNPNNVILLSAADRAVTVNNVI